MVMLATVKRFPATENFLFFSFEKDDICQFNTAIRFAQGKPYSAKEQAHPNLPSYIVYAIHIQHHNNGFHGTLNYHIGRDYYDAYKKSKNPEYLAAALDYLDAADKDFTLIPNHFDGGYLPILEISKILFTLTQANSLANLPAGWHDQCAWYVNRLDKYKDTCQEVESFLLQEVVQAYLSNQTGNLHVLVSTMPERPLLKYFDFQSIRSYKRKKLGASRRNIDQLSNDTKTHFLGYPLVESGVDQTQVRLECLAGQLMRLFVNSAQPEYDLRDRPPGGLQLVVRFVENSGSLDSEFVKLQSIGRVLTAEAMIFMNVDCHAGNVLRSDKGALAIDKDNACYPLVVQLQGRANEPVRSDRKATEIKSDEVKFTLIDNGQPVTMQKGMQTDQGLLCFTYVLSTRAGAPLLLTAKEYEQAPMPSPTSPLFKLFHEPKTHKIANQYAKDASYQIESVLTLLKSWTYGMARDRMIAAHLPKEITWQHYVRFFFEHSAGYYRNELKKSANFLSNLKQYPVALGLALLFELNEFILHNPDYCGDAVVKRALFSSAVETYFAILEEYDIALPIKEKFLLFNFSKAYDPESKLDEDISQAHRHGLTQLQTFYNNFGMNFYETACQLQFSSLKPVGNLSQAPNHMTLFFMLSEYEALIPETLWAQFVCLPSFDEVRTRDDQGFAPLCCAIMRFLLVAPLAAAIEVELPGEYINAREACIEAIKGCPAVFEFYKENSYALGLSLIFEAHHFYAIQSNVEPSSVSTVCKSVVDFYKSTYIELINRDGYVVELFNLHLENAIEVQKIEEKERIASSATQWPVRLGQEGSLDFFKRTYVHVRKHLCSKGIKVKTEVVNLDAEFADVASEIDGQLIRKKVVVLLSELLSNDQAEQFAALLRKLQLTTLEEFCVAISVGESLHEPMSAASPRLFKQPEADLTSEQKRRIQVEGCALATQWPVRLEQEGSLDFFKRTYVHVRKHLCSKGIKVKTEVVNLDPEFAGVALEIDMLIRKKVVVLLSEPLSDDQAEQFALLRKLQLTTLKEFCVAISVGESLHEPMSAASPRLFKQPEADLTSEQKRRVQVEGCALKCLQKFLVLQNRFHAITLFREKYGMHDPQKSTDAFLKYNPPVVSGSGVDDERLANYSSSIGGIFMGIQSYLAAMDATNTIDALSSLLQLESDGSPKMPSPRGRG